MVHRRTVLRLGVSGVAGALLGVSANALVVIAPDAKRPSLFETPTRFRTPTRLTRFSRAIFDGGSAEGLAFALEMRSISVATSEARADLAQLWYSDLQARLRQSPEPIAGLTDRGTLFCLEELARSVGMKVRYRVEHKVDAAGQLRHDAAGPASIVEAASRLDTEPGYGNAMAVLARQFDPHECGGTDAQKRTGPFSQQGAPVLVSWLIA